MSEHGEFIPDCGLQVINLLIIDGFKGLFTVPQHLMKSHDHYIPHEFDGNFKGYVYTLYISSILTHQTTLLLTRNMTWDHDAKSPNIFGMG